MIWKHSYSFGNHAWKLLSLLTQDSHVITRQLIWQTNAYCCRNEHISQYHLESRTAAFESSLPQMLWRACHRFENCFELSEFVGYWFSSQNLSECTPDHAACILTDKGLHTPYLLLVNTVYNMVNTVYKMTRLWKNCQTSLPNHQPSHALACCIRGCANHAPSVTKVIVRYGNRKNSS